MMDLVLEAWVSSSIEAAKLSWMMGKGKSWQPGEKLKLLFAGYNGTRNMGSDVRVSEMLRQTRHILGGGQHRFQRDDAKFQVHRWLLRRHAAGSPARTFSLRFFPTRCPSITAWWPAKDRCSKASLPTRSPR